MKKFRKITVLFIALVTIAAAVPAFAREGDKQLDLMLDLSTSPASGFDTTAGPIAGLSIGAGYELRDGWQLRGDLAYHYWDRDVWGRSLSYTRIPVSASVRKYFTLPQPKGLKVFGQAGLEISYDIVETPYVYPVWIGWTYYGTAEGKKSDNKLRLGVPLTTGAEYEINSQYSVGASVTAHVVNDSYLTVGLAGSYHF